MARDSRGRFTGSGGGGATIDASAFLQDLHIIEVELRKAVHDAVRDAVQATEEAAKATTLYQDRTGDLRKSTRGEMKFSINGTVKAGGKDAPYGAFVNNGTSMMAARPFMDDARAVGEKVLDYGLEYYCDQAINKAG